jgi:ABC-type glycerol-3-phosphate transport system permease component
MVEVIIGICLLAFIFGFAWVVMTIISFFDAVPKQLKRIADALERMAKKDG